MRLVDPFIADWRDCDEWLQDDLQQPLARGRRMTVTAVLTSILDLEIRLWAHSWRSFCGIERQELAGSVSPSPSQEADFRSIACGSPKSAVWRGFELQVQFRFVQHLRLRWQSEPDNQSSVAWAHESLNGQNYTNS